MGKAIAVTCPHCSAPLAPASDAQTVRCEYCGHVARLHRTRALPHQPAVIHVSDVTRRARPVVLPFVAAMLLIIGTIAAVVVLTVTRASRESSDQVARARSEALVLAEQMGTDILEKAERLQQRALEPGTGAAASADAAPPPTEAAPRPRRQRKKPSRSAPPVPDAPDRDAVVRALEGLDLSACPGPATITYGIRVNPDGTTRTTSSGPMRATGGALTCVSAAIRGLRFPASREGLELKREFVVPAPDR